MVTTHLELLSWAASDSNCAHVVPTSVGLASTTVVIVWTITVALAATSCTASSIALCKVASREAVRVLTSSVRCEGGICTVSCDSISLFYLFRSSGNASG